MENYQDENRLFTLLGGKMEEIENFSEREQEK